MFNIKTFFSRIMSVGEIQRQSIVSLTWQIIFTIIGFLSTIYFAHTVGASVLGAYFLFLAYYDIIGMVIDGGFGQAAIKRISEGEEQNAYFSAFFVLNSLSVIGIVSALIVFHNKFIEFNSSGTFIWLLLALIASLFYRTLSSGIAGCGKIGIQSTCNFINDFSRVIVQVVAVFFGYGVAGLAGGFVAGMVLSAIMESHFFNLHFAHFGWKHIKSLANISFWLFLTSSGMIAFSYADVVLIGYFLNNADVGVYRIALQFSTLAVFTTAALRATLWPKVSRWGKMEETKRIENSFSSAVNYSLILAIPVFVGGFLLGDSLLYFFYGDEFAQGYKTLIILLIVQVINVFQYFITMYLSALNHQKEAFKVTAVAVVANIILNLILIPALGILGAAIATLVTMALNVFLGKCELSKVMTVKIDKSSLSNISKSTIFMGIFVGTYRFFVTLSNIWLTLIPVIVGMVIYGLVLLRLDENIHDELKGIATQMNLLWPYWL